MLYANEARSIIIMTVITMIIVIVIVIVIVIAITIINILLILNRLENCYVGHVAFSLCKNNSKKKNDDDDDEAHTHEHTNERRGTEK